jgi:Domain of unknown function (DUF3425)
LFPSGTVSTPMHAMSPLAFCDLPDDPHAFFDHLGDDPHGNQPQKEGAIIIADVGRRSESFSKTNAASTPAVDHVALSSPYSSSSSSSPRSRRDLLSLASHFSDERMIVLQHMRPYHAFMLNGRLISNVLPNYTGYVPPHVADDVSNITIITHKPPATSCLIPANLWPTRIQCTVPHHPWLDILPWPKIRDKLIAFSEHFDFKGDTDDCFLLHNIQVWGSCPELVCSWEFGEHFVQKYWFLLDNEILQHTNWWRAQRHLPPLSLKSSL